MHGLIDCKGLAASTAAFRPEPIVANRLLLTVFVPWLMPLTTRDAIKSTTGIVVIKPQGRRCRALR